MKQTHSEQKAGKRFLGIALAFFVLSLFLVGLVGWYFISYLKPLSDPVNQLKNALEAITSNEIKQDGHTLEIQTNTIKELATVEREMQSIIKYEGSFLGQKKLLILKGNFRATAGFDLTETNRLSIENGEISGLDQKAEVLGVELLDFEIYHSQDSAFNKLKPEDQEAATKQLLEQARKDADQSDLREQAELRLKERINDLLLVP